MKMRLVALFTVLVLCVSVLAGVSAYSAGSQSRQKRSFASDDWVYESEDSRLKAKRGEKEFASQRLNAFDVLLGSKVNVYVSDSNWQDFYDKNTGIAKPLKNEDIYYVYPDGTEHKEAPTALGQYQARIKTGGLGGREYLKKDFIIHSGSWRYNGMYDFIEASRGESLYTREHLRVEDKPYTGRPVSAKIAFSGALYWQNEYANNTGIVKPLEDKDIYYVYPDGTEHKEAPTALGQYQARIKTGGLAGMEFIYRYFSIYNDHPAPLTLKINNVPDSLWIGKEYRMGTLSEPAEAKDKVKLIYGTDNPDVVEVNKDTGVIKPLKLGDAKIWVKVSYDQYYADAVASQTVTCYYSPPKLIIEGVPEHLDIDQTYRMKAVLEPAEAKDKFTLEYGSDDPEIAEVNKVTGEITPKKVGKTKIWVKTERKDGYDEAYASQEIFIPGVDYSWHYSSSFNKLTAFYGPDDDIDTAWHVASASLIAKDADYTGKPVAAHFEADKNWTKFLSEGLGIAEPPKISYYVYPDGSTSEKAPSDLGHYIAVHHALAPYPVEQSFDIFPALTIDKQSAPEKLYWDEQPPQLKAVVRPEGSDAGNLKFASSDANVAKIDPVTGNVTLNGPGTATLTVSSDKKGINPANVKITVLGRDPGLSLDIPAELYYGDESAKAVLNKVTNAEYKFDYDPAGVLTVDKNGKIKISDVGKTTLTVSVPAAQPYASASVGKVIEVQKAVPAIVKTPTAAGITYGQRLEESKISGGAASVAGEFKWKSGKDVLNAGKHEADAVFYPKDSKHYSPVDVKITVNVDKALPEVRFTSTVPKELDVDGTFRLAAVSSAGEDAEIVYSSSDPAAVVDARTGAVTAKKGADSVTLTARSKETANYKPAEASVKIKINRKPAGLKFVLPSEVTFGDIGVKAELSKASDADYVFSYDPEGYIALDGTGAFSYVNPHNNITVTVSLPETDRYKAESKSAVITVNQADVVFYEKPTASAIKQGQPLSASNIRGSASAEGGFRWRDPDAVLGAGTHENVPALFVPNDLGQYRMVQFGLTVKVVADKAPSGALTPAPVTEPAPAVPDPAAVPTPAPTAEPVSTPMPEPEAKPTATVDPEQGGREEESEREAENDPKPEDSEINSFAVSYVKNMTAGRSLVTPFLKETRDIPYDPDSDTIREEEALQQLTEAVTDAVGTAIMGVYQFNNDNTF